MAFSLCFRSPVIKDQWLVGSRNAKQKTPQSKGARFDANPSVPAKAVSESLGVF